MAKYITLLPVKQNGKPVPVGATVELDKQEAAALLLIKAVADAAKAAPAGKAAKAEK
ncbi:MAG: hypothetical protein FWF41_05535 [Betaproteobacteria bacterium]|nr:hypothetical protein [Betaproteobacteria bacterium]